MERTALLLYLNYVPYFIKYFDCKNLHSFSLLLNKCNIIYMSMNLHKSTFVSEKQSAVLFKPTYNAAWLLVFTSMAI